MITKMMNQTIYHPLHDDNNELIQPSCSREYQYLLSDEEEDDENGQSQFVMKRKFATFTEKLVTRKSLK